MQALRDELLGIVEANAPMTVRQVFYRAVSAGLIAKTENEYRQTICRLLKDMRLEGDLAFSDIVDGTRWMHKPPSFKSLDAAVQSWQAAYRRDLWDAQETYVEVWIEKDALVGVLYPVTKQWDVPLMPTRGYPSLSFLAEAAGDIDLEERPVVIYYIGDHDPSGIDIARNVEERLREFAPDADLTFERLALLPEQIALYDLPTRPTKATDSRSKSWAGGESVEVDALAPEVLRQLVEQAILHHVDHEHLEVTRAVEESERELLSRVTSRVTKRRQR
jgi:hypothetical protein